VHVFFGPRNPLTGNGSIAVNYGCVGACFGPRSPLTSFGGITIKLEEDFCFVVSPTFMLGIYHNCDWMKERFGLAQSMVDWYMEVLDLVRFFIC